MGRQAAGRVARMHTSLFYMLHNARNVHGLPVTQRIHIHLNRA